MGTGHKPWVREEVPSGQLQVVDADGREIVPRHERNSYGIVRYAADILESKFVYGEGMISTLTR